MMTIHGSQSGQLCNGLSRRDFLRVGFLGVSGLSLADVIRLRAAAPSGERPKSVIMVYLHGGPSHLDMFDMKPDAPVEFRGEFKPMRTNVSGVEFCEHLPLHARIADKLAVVRGVKAFDEHDNWGLMTGVVGAGRTSSDYTAKHPEFGSVVSRVRGCFSNQMPTFVDLGGSGGGPAYLGNAHRPFKYGGEAFQNLTLRATPQQLEDRKQLLRAMDGLRSDLDSRGEMAGMDASNTQALDMIASGRVREAFDLRREPEPLRALYGPHTSFLLARRLVEAGVSVVTVAGPATGTWDTHGNAGGTPTESNFTALRKLLPPLDQAVYALITDLHDRGLDRDVAVVVWGEFGRTPRINKFGGRDHWSPAGCVLLSGGGLQVGCTVGETDARAERARTRPFTVQNVLATLYHVLGIDAAQLMLPDANGRPIPTLEDTTAIKELV